MKRFLAAACVSTCVLLIPARAQVDAEDFKRMNGTVEALNEGQEVLRRQVQDLREAFTQLRQENAQLKQQLLNSGEWASREQLKEVVKSIQAVDEKRLADAAYVRKQLEDIAREVNRSLAAPPKESSRPAAPKPAAPEADSSSKLPDKQYVHTVRSGETVGAIIAAYNKEYSLTVKVADVLAANPNLKDPKRLKVGQELNIPAVK